MFRKTFLAALVLAQGLLAVPAAAQSAPPAQDGVGRLDSFNEELGLPYWAPGRGEVDHDALRRRSLAVLERQFGAFREASAGLAETASAHCAGTADAAEIKAALRDAWLAWAPLDSYQFGPVEQLGAALTVNFWPDKKDFVGRGLKALEALSPEDLADPATIAQGSAATQGLPAIERLLYTDMEACPSIVGISLYMEDLGGALYEAWFTENGWADLANAAGPDNPVYLSPEEFTKTLYTAVDFGLTRVAESRLGRPLGTFDRPFPDQAEAWRSGLSNEIILAQIHGLAEMVRLGFAGDVRETDRGWILEVFEQTEGRLAAIEQPISEAVKEPTSRIRVEAMQTKVRHLQLEMAKNLGPNLGVETGFSAADGD
ncbi:imelysin family protein [Tropicimonas aquimaris]|uniref:Imelysin family protein n=1 Tax=Tropicimonas aquimaris TaxID=914152 RepID=A0ABW3IT37_9RHOB